MESIERWDAFSDNNEVAVVLGRRQTVKLWNSIKNCFGYKMLSGSVTDASGLHFFWSLHSCLCAPWPMCFDLTKLFLSIHFGEMPCYYHSVGSWGHSYSVSSRQFLLPRTVSHIDDGNNEQTVECVSFKLPSEDWLAHQIYEKPNWMFKDDFTVQKPLHNRRRLIPLRLSLFWLSCLERWVLSGERTSTSKIGFYCLFLLTKQAFTLGTVRAKKMNERSTTQQWKISFFFRILFRDVGRGGERMKKNVLILELFHSIQLKSLKKGSKYSTKTNIITQNDSNKTPNIVHRRK